MATYKSTGDIVNLTTVAAVNGGDVVVVQDILEVVIADIAAGETGSAYVKGIFEFTTAATISDGDSVYYNASSDTITDTDTDVYAGRAIGDNVGTTVQVSINWMSEVAGS